MGPSVCRVYLLGVLLVSVTGLLGACAPSDSVGGVPSQVALSPAAPRPCVRKEGFALSLAIDRGGASSPELAAARFAGNADPPGYGTRSTQWTRESHAADAVVLRGADVWLHLIELRDGTWAVDSGGRCR